MDRLPLTRGADGQLRFDGSGPVALTVDRTDVVRNGGQGSVYRGKMFHAVAHGGSLIMEVRVQSYRYIGVAY